MAKQCREVSVLGMALLLLVTISCKNLFAPSDYPPDILWSKTYGGPSYDVGRSVQETSDGGYIIAGDTRPFELGYAEVYLIKTDANGDSIWIKTYGGTNDDVGHSVQQTSDGGYIVAGGTMSFGTGHSDIYLIKTDANGNVLWTKTYGGTNWDDGRSVQQTSDGGYIIAGKTDSFGAGGTDIYLIKTDANGDTIWTKTYGGTSGDYGYSLVQTADQGYIIAGETWSFGGGGADVYLIKTDANGDTIWTKTYGGAANDYGRSVQLISGIGYIVAGETWSFGAGGADVYLIKTDVNGDVIWTQTYGGTDGDWGYSVQQTSDKGYIIAGKTTSFGAGLTDVYLIKTEP